jgi:hypothetical protein
VVEAALTRRRLVVVWLALAALVGAIVVIESAERLRGKPGDTDELAARLLVPLPLDELGAVEIADAGRLHRFERDASGTWFYHGAHGAAGAAHTHAADPATADRIRKAFAALCRTRIERRFALEGNGTTYGVTAPDVLILVYRSGQAQPVVQFAVGHVAPDTVSRYVMAVGSPTVVTIPNYQIDNLLALIQAAGGSAPPSSASANGR